VTGAPNVPGRRVLSEEVLVVLALSLLASAVYSLIDLLSAPVAGVIRATYRPVPLAPQLADIVFGLAPVALVLHLVRRSREGLRPIGLATETLASDAAWGTVLALAVGGVGLAVYVVSVRLGVNRFVIPVPPLGHWWTVPILLLGAVQAALLEEVIVAGYLIRRLEQLGWTSLAAIAGSALLRGAYHLYQGWGGFAGNLALGAVFGWVFVRWRRTWPLITAHFLVDAMAGLGYLAFRGDCVLKVCIR
jgi:membrane protease YdiL (CAAX protease family)